MIDVIPRSAFYMVGVGNYGKSIIKKIKDRLSKFKEDYFNWELRYVLVDSLDNNEENIITEDCFKVTIMIADLDENDTKETIINVAKNVREKTFLSTCFFTSKKKLDETDSIISELLSQTDSVIPNTKEELFSRVYQFIQFLIFPCQMGKDMEDVKNMISSKKLTYLGIGEASGENKEIIAVDKALSDNNAIIQVMEPKRICIDPVSDESISYEEMCSITNRIKSIFTYKIKICLGLRVDEEYKDRINILLVATED